MDIIWKEQGFIIFCNTPDVVCQEFPKGGNALVHAKLKNENRELKNDSMPKGLYFLILNF